MRAIKILDEIIGEEENFGRMIQAFRQAENLTQVQFAKKLEISKQHLCDIEKGRKLVSPERAARFAEILGYSQKGFVALALQDVLTSGGLKYRVRLEAA